MNVKCLLRTYEHSFVHDYVLMITYTKKDMRKVESESKYDSWSEPNEAPPKPNSFGQSLTKLRQRQIPEVRA